MTSVRESFESVFATSEGVSNSTDGRTSGSEVTSVFESFESVFESSKVISGSLEDSDDD